jgi:hypothetical protein
LIFCDGDCTLSLECSFSTEKEKFMVRKLFAVLVLMFWFSGQAHAYPSKLIGKEINQYFKNMSCDYARGFNNVADAPLEYYYAGKEYEQQKKGRPVIRNITGFVDGTFRVIERTGSGMWDFFAGLVPGDQDGVPAEPETISILR